jgi:cilia- and flagella-associated protein 57
MSIGKLNIHQAFGVSKESHNCLTFIDEHTIVYVAGHHAVIMNLDNKEQQFIPGGTHMYRSLAITALGCSWPKKVIAVGEKAKPVGGCTFYDMGSLRRRKTIYTPDLGSTTVAACAFSNDGRFFLMQGGAPEWNLTLWNVEKAPKLLANLKLNSSEDITVDEVSFCPWDANVVVICGKSTFKVLRFLEGALRPHNISLRRDTAHFTSHVWLKTNDRMVVATTQGEILLIENLEFRAIVYPTGAEGEEIVPVLKLVSSTNGFIAGTVAGEFRVFDVFEDSKEHYQLENTIYLGDEHSDPQAMALGYEDNLIVITNQQQMYTVSLHNQGASKDQAASLSSNLLTPFHGPGALGHAAIQGLSFALWRPLLATCGLDNTVRLWNVYERRQEICKTVDGDPIDVSMHPTGLYLVLAFVDKLVFYSVLLGKLNETKEIPIRQCNIVKYADGGHMVAAASGSSILIYDGNTGSQIAVLRGHQSRIRSLKFLNNDSTLVSVGAEGSVFTWDIPSASKNEENQVVSNQPFISGGAHPDGSKAYCITADKLCKEMYLEKIYDPTTGHDITPAEPRSVDIGKPIGPVLFDESRGLLFMASSEDDHPGSVASLMTSPHISSTVEWLDIHSGPITAMCLSPDSSQLITADENGVIVISDIEGTGSIKTLAMKMLEGSSAFEFIDEVLIHRQDLENKKRKIAELSGKVDDLNLNNDHQLRLKEMDHKSKVKEISAKFHKELENESTKYAELMGEKTMVETTYKSEMTDKGQTQELQLERMKLKFEEKLNQEEERHRALRTDTQKAHELWNVENAALVDSHQDYLREITAEYEEKLRKEKIEQKNIVKSKEDIKMDSDELLISIDDDATNEVNSMNIRYETRLQKENEAGVALMAEHAVLKKNLQLLVKDAGQQKEDIKRLQDREKRLIETIKSLEKDIISHKKEMREREETVADKEKRIFDLKKKNQELEKFRFVLDYKIKELKLQIAPREAEITTMRKQIEEMDLELEQYHKSNRALNLMIGELKLKLDGLGKENESQLERFATNSRIQAQIKRDVKDLWEVAGDGGKLKAAVISLYRLYVQEETTGKRAQTGGSSTEGVDPQEVYNRDRETMERNLEGLKRAIKQDAKAFKRDLSKMQRENVMLTNELNELRKDSRSMQLQKKAIENGYKIGLNTAEAIVDLMNLLHMKIPRALENPDEKKEILKKQAKSGKPPGPPSSAKRGPGSSETRDHPQSFPPVTPHEDGEERGMMEVQASPAPAHKRASSPRTAALRTTSAGGHVLDKARAAKLAGGKTSAADHWEAWREIQIQHDQMVGLEEKMKTLCHSLEIDPEQMLASIDATLLMAKNQGT